jgi:hypothetical protein
MKKSVAERFWEKVDGGESNECWNWNAFVHPTGYGMMNIRKNGNTRMVLAHRISWELHFGKIPDGLCVLHHCDNRKCVNPNHLFLGTYQDNASDRDKKNRGKIPDNRGENHGHHKLTEKDVREIRILMLSGECTQKAVAKMYGIKRQQVSKIVLGLGWGWLE